MKTIHFDVDSSFFPYLEGEKYPYSLRSIPKGKIFQCDAISIKANSKVNSDTFSHFPSLKLIVTRTVGTDHIGISECKKRKIAVYRIIDYGSFAIAEHALALMLSGARKIREADKKVRSGVFSYDNLCGNTIHGKTIGIIGTGRIGLELIKLLKPFNTAILAFDVFQNKKAAADLNFKYVDLDELLKNSDFISLHTPLTPESHHLINANTIYLMKENVTLINTARGGLIDTQALIRNIEKFSFVGLDVLEGEENFDKKNPLLNYSNILITPHIAFYTDATIRKIAQETKKNIERFQKGEAYGLVYPSYSGPDLIGS
ncbi:hypothetical protein A3D77_06535 [Candidatus Gottesmanbacteria bacterium RIFCSPHIGHO2_02_FULL_39_11]|uniref:Hydroxyacid dehydrogenase n=1 Tax=Candidatus Gottesmanbacteria bacterium RIFCSPHIGHO2_02_FULL_39_11 TaxID=1798382 RepID=A0A1F5ZSQ0_9BACT|nr:MAG: hypothetical protein A3D77_06535 [Candidatus Gottesmanbacteria bacterium RIFCSPHIGHO2_02_FULL_39_11]